MKYLASALVPLVLIAPSCSTITSAREKLTGMSEESFLSLQRQVGLAGSVAGTKLKDAVSPEVAGKVYATLIELAHSIMRDQVAPGELVPFIVEQIAKDLDGKVKEYIRLGGLALDVAVGPIRLGIDGTLSVREKAVLLTFLGGIAQALEQ